MTPQVFPKSLGHSACASHYRDTDAAPAKRLSKGRRLSARALDAANCPSRFLLRTDPGEMSQKNTSNLPSPRRYLRLAHCPFVNACWGRVKIRRVLHYDASSCMKVYFKESLEEGRGSGRMGRKPERGGLKEGCVTEKRLGCRIKLCFTCKGKLTEFLFGSRESYSHRVPEKLLLFPDLLSPCPLPRLTH